MSGFEAFFDTLSPGAAFAVGLFFGGVTGILVALWKTR